MAKVPDLPFSSTTTPSHGYYLRRSSRKVPSRNELSCIMPLINNSKRPKRVVRTPSCIIEINKKYAKSPKDTFMIRGANFERRLLLVSDTSLNNKKLEVFNDRKIITMVCSLLSRKKRSKTPYHVNGLLVSQQKGHYHVINRVVFDPDISFKFIPSASIVKGVANREIGLNFKSCNGPAPTFVDLYKNLKDTILCHDLIVF